MAPAQRTKAIPEEKEKKKHETKGKTASFEGFQPVTAGTPLLCVVKPFAGVSSFVTGSSPTKGKPPKKRNKTRK